MRDKNPWKVESIEAFSFYCCPECDFKSKDRYYFKRHAMESHNKSKIFFVLSKSEDNTSNDSMEVETELESQHENEDSLEEFVASETTLNEELLSEFEEEEFVKVGEHKTQKLIIGSDLKTFNDNVTADYFKDYLKTFDDQQAKDNVKELETFDGANYENITDAETSDEETFDGMDLAMKSYDDHDVKKSKTFDREIFENVNETGTKYFVDTDEEENSKEIENQKIPKSLLPEKFGQAKSEKPKKEKKSISSKGLDLKLSIINNKGKITFKCNICDYSCYVKGAMNRHIRFVHEGKRPFKCEMCDKPFFSKSHLNEHMESAHSENRPYKCRACPSSFKQVKGMRRHRKNCEKLENLEKAEREKKKKKLRAILGMEDTAEENLQDCIGDNLGNDHDFGAV